ncbi:MAG: hypothetical protein AB1744_05935 [Candidatus Zixiibacteriota bacterium]
MKQYPLLVVMCLLLAGAAPAHGQFSQDTLDLGAADTVDLVFSVVPHAAINQLQLQVELWVFNDSNTLVGVSMGFSWDNPNLQMDSASASPMTDAAFDIGPFLFEDDNLATTNANQRWLFGGAKIFASGILPAPARQLWATYYFTLSSWTVNDSIAIDTLQFNPGSVFQFVSQGQLVYRA